MQSTQSKPIQSLSFQELFQMGEQKYQELDYEQAEYFYHLAYQKSPHNQAIIMCYANVLKQNQKHKQAKKILQKSIKEQPNGTYKRFFELGQIYHGVEAIKSFQSGIAQATKHLKNPFKSVTPDHQIKRDIAQAYASIAEICMTDLIDQPQAEAKCIQALQKGKNADVTCMDVHLQIANYQLFKENFDIARAELNIIFEAVKGKKQEYDSELVLQAAKYFIELDDFLRSQQLLEVIHEQQGNESQIVYLLAYCAYKAQKYEQCEQYIEEYEQGENNIKDQQVEEAMKELIVELEKIRPTNKLANINNGMDETGQNQQLEDGDGDWMDVQDEDN